MSLIQKMIVETHEKPPRQGIVVAADGEFRDKPKGDGTSERVYHIVFGVTFPDEEGALKLVEFFDNEDLTPISPYDTADALAVHTCPDCRHEFRTEDEGRCPACAEELPEDETVCPKCQYELSVGSEEEEEEGEDA